MLRTMAAVMAVTLLGTQGTAASRSLTLDETIRMALRGNEGLAIERASVAAAKATVTSSSGAYDPVLELDGGWVRSKQPSNVYLGSSALSLAGENETAEAGATVRQLLPSGGALAIRARGGRAETEGLSLLSTAYDTRVGVELRQPLLRNLATDAARRDVQVARSVRLGAAAGLRRAVSETVAAVERSYWSLVAARLGAEVRDESVRLAEEQLEQTRARVESGDVPRTELAQPLAELERRRGERLAARETVARAENALKLLILNGADDPLWSERLEPADSAGGEHVPADVEQALKRALESRPELTSAAAEVERRRSEAAYAKDGLRPRLDAMASYDRFGLAGSRNASIPSGIPTRDGGLGGSFESLGDGDYDEARVALVLELPVGNREAHGAAAAARETARQAEAEMARVRKTIRAEVLDAAAGLETAAQRIDAARAARHAAEIQLDAERQRYATGLSTNFLVLTRQNDLSRARLDEIGALTDYRQARTELSRASATLIEDRGIDLNEKNAR